MKLFYGVATLTKTDGIVVHRAHGVCQSEAEFVGLLTRLALEENEGYLLKSVVATEVEPESIRKAAAHLTPKPE